MSIVSQPSPNATPTKSTLRVVVPHWAANIQLFDDLSQPVAGMPQLRADGHGQFAAEIAVEPGIYDLEISFLGKTVREVVSIRRGRTKEWKKSDWSEFASPPALEAARQPLEHLMRGGRVTWKNHGDSRLLLALRTLDENGEPTLPSSVRLHDANGALVTDFSTNVETNTSAGSVAFGADLPAGLYVLKSNTVLGGVWCRPIHLSTKWETQMAISFDRSAGGQRLVSLRMANLHGPAMPATDAAAVASAAVLDVLANGDASSFIVKAHIDALTQGEHADPWLAVLAGYALLQSIEQQPYVLRVDVDKDSQNLLEELRGFLTRELPDHPDARAITLTTGTAEAPFAYPPMLRAGLKRVQAHAARHRGTITPGSLLDTLVDDASLGAPWSTWVERPANDADRADRASARVERPTFLRNVGAKAPVFRVNQPRPRSGDALGSATSASSPGDSETPSAREKLRDAQIVNFVSQAVYRGSPAMPLPELNVDTKTELNALLSIDPMTICRSTGLPIERVDGVLAALRGGQLGTTLEPSVPPARISWAEEQLVAYTIGENAFAPKTPGDAPAVTIEELVAKLRSVTAGITAAAQIEPTREYSRIGGLTRGLDRAVESLLRRAALIGLTAANGDIVYANGAFLAFLDLGDASVEPPTDNRPTSWAPQETWESVLRSAPVGESTLTGVAGLVDTTRWHLRRAPVKDSDGTSSIAFANVLTVEGAQTMDEQTLMRVSELIHAISLGLSIYAHGSVDGREAHGANAERALADLERLLINDETNNANASPFTENPMSNDAAQTTSGLTSGPKTPGSASLIDLAEFSIDRHQLIAGAAEQLMSKETAKAVERLVEPLGAGTNLADLAAWADQIKRRKPTADDDADTVAFLNDPRNATQPTWHYVDIPAGAETYDRAALPEFTRDDDVVQMLIHAIKVLQKQSSRFTDLNALRLIVHLVGDVHQPVHVGCSFFDLSAAKPALVLDPKIVKAKGLESDRGGNLVLLPIGTKGTGLHGYWDSRLGGKVTLNDLVTDSDVAAAVAAFEAYETVEADAEPGVPAASPDEKRAAIARLVAMVNADRQPTGVAQAEAAQSGSPDQWPIMWANESLAAARSAYGGLVAQMPVGQKTKNVFVKFEKSREEYDTRNGPILIRRMKAAASNLAKLLDALLG